MRTMGGAFFALVLLAGSAAAGEIYVNNTAGDDRFSGRFPENLPDGTGPVQTITRALELTQSGDRVALANTGRPYRESISLVGSRHSGYAGQPFALLGNGAVLDGSAPVPPDAWQHDHDTVFRFRPPRMGHQMLFLDGKPARRAMVSRLSDAVPKLEPLEWCFHAGSVYFCVPRERLPADYDLRYTHLQTGITLFHVRRVQIVGLTVQGFQVDGIHAYNSARDVELVQVTCLGNGRHGVAVGAACNVKIEASSLGDNGGAQLRLFGYSEANVRTSRLLAGTGPAYDNSGGRLYIDDQYVEGPPVDSQD